MLKIGGIYTFKEKKSVKIVVSEQSYITLLNLDFFELNNKCVNDYIYDFLEDYKFKQFALERLNIQDIDGYLGVLTDSNLKKLRRSLNDEIFGQVMEFIHIKKKLIQLLLFHYQKMSTYIYLKIKILN